jgi:PIN domain nuclease of toxin-antitoxin system
VIVRSVLLDTCAVLDLAAGLELPPRAALALRAVIDGCEAWVPAVVALEVAQKVWAGKRSLDASTTIWFGRVIRQIGLRTLRLCAQVAPAAYALPEPFHRDAADHMIVATARRLRMPILTPDREILAYAAAGHVAAIGY